MLTAGLDLATEPAGTALATVEWWAGNAQLTTLRVDVDDDAILQVARTVEKFGIDCPLGWPRDFLVFLVAHDSGHAPVPADVTTRDWRRRLAYRDTDRAIRTATGITPLSVATDRIGRTAMRAAGLLARLADAGHPVDRAGTGVMVEVYPAAALKLWDLTARGYKGARGRETLVDLLKTLRRSAPWLDLGSYASLCGQNHDAFDAVVAALISRAAALGQVTMPTDAQGWRLARTEGWIALPTSGLSGLVG